MNPLMFILLMTLATFQPANFLGIVIGLLICYILTDEDGKINIIKKLTTWKWGDFLG